MNKRLLYALALIIGTVMILTRCISEEKEKDLRGSDFAGSSSCASCHREVYESYLSTAHHNTSSPSADSSIPGSFHAPDNRFRFANGTEVVMEKRDSGIYQAAYRDAGLEEAHRFEMTIGSGRKAQTYLYFEGDKYYQLPLSYLVSVHNWANSPGFPSDHPRFDRIVNSNCFGCHTSKAVVKGIKAQGTSYSEQFEKGQVVYGIDCERCHGPAAAHVAFHEENPTEKKAMFITRIDTLKNERKLDMCAVCHSGLKASIQPVFNFRPGSSLKDYFYPDLSRPKATELDIHGTQYQLFTASQCFIGSTDMNCSSCHNPHVSERADMQVFSQRCMSCHNEATHNFCTNMNVPEAVLKQNCIDCHMPALPSRAITLLPNGREKPTADSIRTHLIAVYKTDAKGVIEMVKRKAD